MRLCPDGSKFATVSADKSIGVFDSDSGDLIKHYTGAHAMGIYDLDWCDDNSFLTCSADNSVKKWQLDQDAAVKEYEQGYKREIPSQLVMVRSLGSSVLALGISGEFTEWHEDGKMVKHIRHKDLIDEVTGHGADIWYASEGQIFRKTPEANHTVKSSHTLKVDIIVSNSEHVFTSGQDKLLIKFDGEGKELAKVTLPNRCISASASASEVFVLCVGNEVLVINATDLVVKKQKKMSWDATASAHSANHVWVGNKKGSVHVLDKATLDEVKVHTDIHTKPVTFMASNQHWVSSGDAYRYIQTYNAETMEPHNKQGDHTDKITSLAFGVDHLVSVTTNNAYGVTQVTDKKFLREVKVPHQEKLITLAAVMGDQTIKTAGYDCAIRSWPLVA